MIYETVSQGTPLRQGDIFKSIPRIDISLKEISVLARNSIEDLSASIEAYEMSWEEAIQDQDVVEHKDTIPIIRAVLPVTIVSGIVVTQDCDAARADDVSLCEIASLGEIFKNAYNLKSVKSWAKTLTKDDTTTAKWFYLPEDRDFGFDERMAVDFMSILRLPRPHLETLKTFRIGRLTDIAYEHFKEKLSHFFRRYPVDPWYPLTKEEYQEYARERPGTNPYPWQE